MRDPTIWRVGKFKPLELAEMWDLFSLLILSSLSLPADIRVKLSNFSDIFESKAGDAGSGNRNCPV